MTKIKFLRADTFRYKRIGKNRRKLQKWRRPRGKNNKLRIKRFGHPVQPGIGFGTPRNAAGRIKGLVPVRVSNVNEMSLLGKGQIAIIARVGAKKKIEMIKKAEAMNVPVSNLGGKR